MATLRGFDRKFYFSYIHAQTTWGTLEAEANLYPFRVNSDPFTIAPELVDDVEEIGGKEEATSMQELSRAVSGTLSQNKTVAPFLASMLAYALGSSTDSTVDTSAGRHIIVPDTAAFTMDTFSALDLFTTSVYVAYHNMAIDSLELSCSRKGWLSTTAQVVGSGNSATSGITVGSLAAAPTMGPALKCGDLRIWKGTANTSLPGTYQQAAEDLNGTPTAITTAVRSFTWRLNNNLYTDQAYEPASGIYRGRAERERRAQTLSFELEFEDNTYLSHLTTGDSLAFELDFTSGTLAGATTVYYGAQLLFPKVMLTSREVSGGAGTLTVNIEGQVQADGTNPTVQATVWDKNTTGLLQ